MRRLKQIYRGGERDKRDSFHRFVNKGESSSADWRREIQACFQRQRRTFWMQNSKTL